MTWADQLLPEDQLAAMLVECQPVRGIVANPYATWSELAAVLDAGTVAEGSTADKVKTAAWNEKEAESSFVSRPRFVVSDNEQDSFTRTSVSGFDLVGNLFVSMELVIPPSLVELEASRKDDIRRKQMAVELSLLRLSRAGGRLDIESINIESGITYGQEHNGDVIALIQLAVRYRGSI